MCIVAIAAMIAAIANDEMEVPFRIFCWQGLMLDVGDREGACIVAKRVLTRRRGELP
jgi:hypothetical protein